jgi:predicted phosphodiesterase
MSEFKHKIAVISDTHSLLRSEIKERLTECELILHAGKTVEEISKKNRVEIQLVNQILQIYTAHQGIDVQGILDRMEIAVR